MDESTLALILVGFVFALMIVFGLIIWKKDWLYEREFGRWKTGINLPGLEAKAGDEIDHRRFKRFVGLNMIMLAIAVLVFVSVMVRETDANELTIEIYLAMVALFLAIGMLLSLMYGNFKERYIKRINSVQPKHHKIILWIVNSMLAIILVILAFFIN